MQHCVTDRKKCVEYIMTKLNCLMGTQIDRTLCYYETIWLDTRLYWLRAYLPGHLKVVQYDTDGLRIIL